MDYSILKQQIKDNACHFGFLEASIASIIIPEESIARFNQWIENGYAGTMNYLTNNRDLRFNPAKLYPQTLSIISVKLPYLSKNTTYHKKHLANHKKAYVSSYALGRDYHKVLRQQLKKYALWIAERLKEYELNHHYRVFTDSAPIMEVELAKNAGLGWRGKNTLLLNKKHGSMFFLGEIFTTLPLPADDEVPNHCGSCNKCIDICPTKAFVAPYVLDARKCISYLTIENKGAIPVELRPAIGNRIYGCDDCQLFCPWNKFSQMATLPDFAPRNQLDNSTLVELFKWNEAEFLERMRGSPILRIGYAAWLRNLAVALGNAPYSKEIVAILKGRLATATPLVKEHIEWALTQQTNSLSH